MTGPVSRTVASSPNGRASAPSATDASHGAPWVATGSLRKGSVLDPYGQRHGRPPETMTPDERLSELGGILAMGYRRARLRQKALAESAEHEAPSNPVVNGNGARAAEEVA